MFFLFFLSVCFGCEKTEPRFKDNGPYYVATLIGEAYANCLEKSSNCPGVTWGDLEDLFAEHSEFLELFEEYQAGRMPNFLSFKVRLLEFLCGCLKSFYL